MARQTSEKVGAGPCPSCGERVIFRRSSGGMLCHKCEECDSSGFAIPNGKAYKLRLAAMVTRYDQDEPAAAAPKVQPKTAKPAPDPADPPPKKRASSVFDLADL